MLCRPLRPRGPQRTLNPSSGTDGNGESLSKPLGTQEVGCPPTGHPQGATATSVSTWAPRAAGSVPGKWGWEGHGAQLFMWSHLAGRTEAPLPQPSAPVPHCTSQF